MQIVSEKRDDLVTSGVTSSESFKITNSSKAFKILSSGLYSNKIKAIQRELGCNGVDSHKEAGNPDPIKVFLPTTLKPVFAVQDYGTGLSRKEVEGLYTTYFESTKTDSNDYIGALGLGSKSPFAYTDNFTVTAVKDGERVVYSAYINEHGVPSVALMHEGKTNEPNGVRVELAVQEKDIWSFEYEAREVFKHFKQIPEFNIDIDIEPIEYEKKDLIPGVHIRKSGGGAAIAVMGNIAYPIEVPQSLELTELERNLLSEGCLTLEFGIGELDIDASREGLSYIDLTVNAIADKIKNVAVEYANDVKAELDAIKNSWERYDAASKIFERGGIAKEIVKDYLETKAKDLPPHDLGNLGVRAGWRMLNPHSVVVNETDWEACNAKVQKFEIRNGMLRARRKDAFHDGYSLPASANHIKLAINDEPRGSITRLRYNVENHPENFKDISIIMLLSPLDNSKPMKVKKLMKLFKSPPLSVRFNISSLKKTVRKPSVKKVGSSMFRLSRSSSGRGWYSENGWRWKQDADVLTESDNNPTDTYVYVKMKGLGVKDSKLGEHIETFRSNMDNALQIQEFQELTIYGVRDAALKEVKARKNWITLEQFIKNIATAKLTPEALDRAKLVIGHEALPSNLKRSKISNSLDPDHKVFEVLGVEIDHDANEGNLRDELIALRRLLRLVDEEDLGKKIDVALENDEYDFDKLFAEYPLAKIAIEHAGYLSENEEAEIIKYIELLDSQK